MSSRRTIIEPQREIPVFRECEVLVIGGGPAGFTAATAAARAGADVVLVERYGHLGGMASGGLVLVAHPTTDGTQNFVVQGLVKETFERLEAIGPAAIMLPPKEAVGSTDPELVKYWNRRHGVRHGAIRWDATIDPEHLKCVCNDMVTQAGVKLLLHTWGTQAIVEQGRVVGAIFESKSGRQAIMADVVVDASGDGDMFYTAGAEFTTELDPHGIMSTISTVFRIGGVDVDRYEQFMQDQPEEFAEIMRRAGEAGAATRASRTARDDVMWFTPRTRSFKHTDIEELTDIELSMRKIMVTTWEFYRQNVPGYEQCFVYDSASQVGTRGSRFLKGTHRLTTEEWKAGKLFDDVIGWMPRWETNVSAQNPNICIPYGTLVPAKVDGLLAAGRCISVETFLFEDLRTIVGCMVTGQAAGAAAAVAVTSRVQPRGVNIEELQSVLLQQGVNLGEGKQHALRATPLPR